MRKFRRTSTTRKGYKPEMIPFWPTSKPIFIPAAQVPPGLWLGGKPAAAAAPAPEAEARAHDD